jgi:hypothetical protein
MVTFDQTCGNARWDCGTQATCRLRDDVTLPIAAQPGLPSGDGQIRVSAAGIVTTTVQWQEANQPNPTSISIDSQMTRT